MFMAKLLQFFREFARFQSLWKSRHTSSQFAGTLAGTVIAYAVFTVMMSAGFTETLALGFASSILTVISPLIARAIAKITFAAPVVGSVLTYDVTNYATEQGKNVIDEMENDEKQEFAKTLFFLGGERIGVWYNLEGLYARDYLLTKNYNYGVNADGEIYDLVSMTKTGNAKLGPTLRNKLLALKQKAGL